MKFKTLQNKEISIEIRADKYPLRFQEDSKSLGQHHLGQILLEIYGESSIIMEEFPIPEEKLILDFYVPHFSIAFEYQGKQHDEFNKFFHGDKIGFQQSIERDKRKREWCEINNIRLIEVRDILSKEELQAAIYG